MPTQHTLSCFLSLLLITAGTASAGVCALSSPLSWHRTVACKCDSGLPAIGKQLERNVSLPPGFELTAACDVRRIPEDPKAILGTFHLRGQRALSGQVRYEYTPAGNLFFTYSKLGVAKVFELRFSDEPAAVKALKIPPLKNGGDCWETQGMLMITQLTVIEDWGTDFTGTYIGAFSPQELAPYRACKN